VSRAVDALARTSQPRFIAADHTSLRSATEPLTRSLGELEPGDTRTPATTPQPSPADLARVAIDAARETGSLIARLAMTPPRERPQDPGTVSPALAALKKARERLQSAIEGAGFEELERETAKTALAFVGRWMSLDQPPEPAYSDLLFAFGATMDDALYARYRAAHSEMITFAAAAIGPRRILTDCDLRAAFGLLGPLPVVTWNPTAAAILAAQGLSAAQVLLRLYFECLCDALNPPCQTCDDPGVLLAEICIRDCVVTDICNMVRRFVITWQSVRYWTDIKDSPFNINALGRAMERICCELRGSLGGGCASISDTVGGVLRRVSGDARTFARLEGGPVETTVPTSEEAMFANLFTSLERLAGAAAPEPPPPLETADPRAVAAMREELTTTRRDLDALRREVESLRH